MADDDMTPILSDKALKPHRRTIRHKLTLAMHQLDALQQTLCDLDDLLGSGGQLGGITDTPQDTMLIFVMDLVDQAYGPDALDGVRASFADVDDFIAVCRLSADTVRQTAMAHLRAMNPRATFPNGHAHGGPPCTTTS